MVLKFCFKVSQSKQNFILFWGVFFQNFQFDPILLRYKRVRQNLKLKKIPANIYWSIFLYLLFNIPYTLFSRDHNENNAFKALFCAIPAITSQLVFNFLTDLFLLDIVIICSTDSAIFYLWRNTPTYLPTYQIYLRFMKNVDFVKDLMRNNAL